jgi:hypothetical protein
MRGLPVLATSLTTVSIRSFCLGSLLLLPLICGAVLGYVWRCRHSRTLREVPYRLLALSSAIGPSYQQHLDNLFMSGVGVSRFLTTFRPDIIATIYPEAFSTTSDSAMSTKVSTPASTDGESER